MVRRTPRSTRTETPFPYTTLFLSWRHQPSFKTGRTDTKDAGLMGPTQVRRLCWLHQPSFKTGRTDTKDAGLMAPTQPTPYAPPDTCKNRRLGWLDRKSTRLNSSH